MRVQFLAVCPDGTSFSWGAPTVPATITSVRPLRRYYRGRLWGRHRHLRHCPRSDIRRDLDGSWASGDDLQRPGERHKGSGRHRGWRGDLRRHCHRRRSGESPDQASPVHSGRHREIDPTAQTVNRTGVEFTTSSRGSGDDRFAGHQFGVRSVARSLQKSAVSLHLTIVAHFESSAT